MFMPALRLPARGACAKSYIVRPSPSMIPVPSRAASRIGGGRFDGSRWLDETPRVAPRPTVAAVRREAIIQAAIRCLARDGASGLRMKRVAREAGVSQAILHY
jgi:hypothetical protein